MSHHFSHEQFHVWSNLLLGILVLLICLVLLGTPVF